jgi:hypothetical protein
VAWARVGEGVVTVIYHAEVVRRNGVACGTDSWLAGG